MTAIGWSLVDAASRLLERPEREVVLGDLYEAGMGAWKGLLDVLGLVVRRQAALWQSWRPWLAGFGLALPASFLLMGVSLSVPADTISARGCCGTTNSSTRSCLERRA